MTVHGSVGPNLGGIGLGAGLEKLENPVHASLARIAEEFAGISDGQLSSAETPLVSDINDIVRPQTPAEACLAPTLALLGWAGEERRIREALPHFDRIENIEAMRLVLTLLGYGTTQRSVGQSEIPNEAMPCLFSRDGSDVMLIVERDSDGRLLALRKLCILEKTSSDKPVRLRVLYLESTQPSRVSRGRKILAFLRGEAI
jgi:ATP-binding cassette subfamily C protein/ATP-binding cassette subfamily C protein LapB